MNRAELRDLTKLILNFNDGQPDNDFTDAQIHTALDQVYSEEIRMAILNGFERFFRKTVEFTWTGSDVTTTVPSTLESAMILSLRNVTNNAIGSEVAFSDFGEEALVFWKDNRTLQWGTTGPSGDTTLRATYMPGTPSLATDGSEPELLPRNYHSLLAWSASVWLRMIAEDGAPPQWIQKTTSDRQDLWKYLTRGMPVSDTPAIKPDKGFEPGGYLF